MTPEQRARLEQAIAKVAHAATFDMTFGTLQPTTAIIDIDAAPVMALVEEIIGEVKESWSATLRVGVEGLSQVGKSRREGKQEGTLLPYWEIRRDTGFGGYCAHAGPFFSREAAEKERAARLYDYGPKSYVFGAAGVQSHDWARLYAASDEAARWLDGSDEPGGEA